MPSEPALGRRVNAYKTWPGPHSLHARIEMALARGDSPDRIAAELGVTVERVDEVGERMDQIAAEDVLS